MRYIDFDRIFERIYSKEITNWLELRERINNDFAYYLWSRCQFEMVITPLIFKEEKRDEVEVKLDVYSQLAPNINIITEYVNKELELGFVKPDIIPPIDHSTSIPLPNGK